MTKIINIHTGKEREIETFDCTICDSMFTENDVALHRGIIGNSLVSLCPICFKGILNLSEHFTPIEE
jgi:hypothetical protein